MPRQNLALALLNALGGVAVLGSYAYAFSYSSELRAGLWGGVPDSLQPIYTGNMLLAAAGYFPFTCSSSCASARRLPRRHGIPLRAALRVLRAGAVRVGAVASDDREDAARSRPAALALDPRRARARRDRRRGHPAARVPLRTRARRRRELGRSDRLDSVLRADAILDAIVWPAYYPQ